MKRYFIIFYRADQGDGYFSNDILGHSTHRDYLNIGECIRLLKEHTGCDHVEVTNFKEVTEKEYNEFKRVD